MHDAKYFFKAVREGDVVTFATNEENERHSWVQALYRATGQSHKPTPPVTATNKSSQGAAGQKDQQGNEKGAVTFVLMLFLQMPIDRRNSVSTNTFKVIRANSIIMIFSKACK